MGLYPAPATEDFFSNLQTVTRPFCLLQFLPLPLLAVSGDVLEVVVHSFDRSADFLSSVSERLGCVWECFGRALVLLFLTRDDFSCMCERV